MAIAKEQYQTIRTLYSLGHSRHMISVVLGIPYMTLHDNFSSIIDGDTKGKKLKLNEYKNAALLALSVESEVAKDKISALNSLDVVDSESNDVVRPVMSDSQFEKRFSDVTSN